MKHSGFLSSVLLLHVALVKTTLILLFFFLCIYSGRRDSKIALWTAAWSAPGAATVMVIPPTALVPGTEVWNTLYHASAKDAPVLLPMPLDSYHVFLVDAKNVGLSTPKASTSFTTTTAETEDRDGVRHPRGHDDGHPSSPRNEKGRSTDHSAKEDEMWPLRHRISTMHIRADSVAVAARRALSALASGEDAYDTSGRSRDPSHAYIPSFLLDPLPLVSPLSDTWEVIADDSIRFQRLLHCRIPYRKTASMVREAEATIIATHEEAMATTLQAWWEERALPRGGEGLFGNGDASGAGIWSWYVLCPMDGFYRVHARLLRAAVLEHHGEEDEEDEVQRQNVAYVQRWKTCHAAFPYRRETAVTDTTTNDPSGFPPGGPHFKWREGGGSGWTSDAPLLHGEDDEDEDRTNPHQVEEGHHHRPRAPASSHRMSGRSGGGETAPAATASDAHPSSTPESPPEEEADDEEKKMKTKKKKKAEIDQLVRAFQEEHLRCTPSFYKLLESPSEPLFRVAITKVGDYRPSHGSGRGDSSLPSSRSSRPRWNADLRAFDMWYPSSTPCMEGRTVTGDPHPTATSSSPAADDARRYWKTHFVFRCRKGVEGPFPRDRDGPAPEAPPHHHTPGGPRQGGGAGGSHAYSHWWSGGGDGVEEDAEVDESRSSEEHGTITWSVIERRQECVMEVELASSEVVCLWDSYLDQVRLNPIPCVEIL